MTFDPSLIASVVQAVKEIRSLLDLLPLKSLLLPQKDKFSELKDKVISLEEKINSDFPKLAQLIKAYSLTISEVKVAKAVSDKASELVKALPENAALSYTGIFTNQIESSQGQINSSISQIRLLEVPEVGALDVRLSTIRDLIRDLKREDDPRSIKRLFDEISTQYTDIQRLLAALLEKILKSFG